jgi:beta-fructofuranosidase
VEVAATRGVAEGVSEKSNAPALLGGVGGAYDWTNAMLSWQRTAFHFQPEKNWMNGRYVAIAILSSSILFN